MAYVLIIEVLLAYLVGSIPSAVWIGKGISGIDVREHGSGNAGATNVIRVLGYKAGIPVFLFDVFKGWFAVQLAFIFSNTFLSGDQVVWLRIGLAVAAVVGHIFPVFAGFRGGKGVATLAGVGIALYPLALLIVLGIFIVTLVASGFVSLSSILAAAAFPFVVYFITGETNSGLLILAVLVAVFIPVSHRKNIRRLIKGEENRFRFRRKKDGEKT
jgi:acyl phosphate:glycerol-3-phosphate acyltransferase